MRLAISLAILTVLLTPCRILYSEQIFILSDRLKASEESPVRYFTDLTQVSPGNLGGRVSVRFPIHTMTKDKLRNKSMSYSPEGKLQMLYTILPWLSLHSHYLALYNSFGDHDVKRLSANSLSDPALIRQSGRLGLDLFSLWKMALRMDLCWDHDTFQTRGNQSHSVNADSLFGYLSVYLRLSSRFFIQYQYQSPSFLQDSHVSSGHQFVFPTDSWHGLSLSVHFEDFHNSELYLSYRRSFYDETLLTDQTIIILRMDHQLKELYVPLTASYGSVIQRSPYSRQRQRIPFFVKVATRLSSLNFSIEYFHYIKNYSNLYIPPETNQLSDRDTWIISSSYQF